MGDARYDPHYKMVREADDRARVIAGMADEDVVAALAAASREHDPYLANVLASEAQNRLRRATALARHLGEGAITIDRNGLVTQVNPAAETLVGLPAERILHRHVHDVLHPDGGHPLHDSSEDCPLLACMAGASTMRREDDRFSREDGSPIHVAYTASPIFRSEEEKEPTGAVIVFQDIGERKAALEQIRTQQQTIEQVARNALRELSHRKRAESIFRSLIEAGPDAQLIVARDGRITTANPKAARLFRVTASLEGTQVEDVLPGAAEVVRKALDDFQTGAFHLTAKRADAQEFPAEVTSGVVSAEGEPLVALAVRDITARKRAEDARARLAAIVQGSQDAIVGRALDGTITSWNAAAERLYGYAEDEVLGMPADLITPEDAAESARTVLECIRTGRTLQGHETVRLHKDGRRIPVSINVWPVRDDAGRIVGAAAIHHNLTESLAARRRLEETSEVLGRIFETTHVGVAYLDTALRVVRVNRAYAEAAGVPPEELPGRELGDLFPGREHEAVLRRVLATGEPYRASATPHRRADAAASDVTHWDWSVQPVRDPDGAVAGLILTFLDVTAKVRAEEALRASEEIFRAVIESGPDAMAIVDERGVIRIANSQLERLFGHAKADMVGRPVEMLMPAALAAKDAATDLPDARNPRGRSAGAGLSVLGRRADGSRFPVEVSLAPIPTREGMLIVAAIRDASARARADAGVAREASRLAAASGSAIREKEILQEVVAVKTAEASVSLHRLEQDLEKLAAEDDAEADREILTDALAAARLAAEAVEDLKAVGLPDDFDALRDEPGRREPLPERTGEGRVAQGED